MKKVLMLFISCSLFLSVSAQGTKEDKPVYLRFPTIPTFTVYKAPDSTVFHRTNLQRNKPTIFMVFSPECSHCQHETSEIIKNIDKFKNAQILMVTYLPYNEMLQFYKDYKLYRYRNITVARDASFFFPQFFRVRNFPSFYVYDKKGNFKKFFEGAVPINEVSDALKL
ncbi:MAG: redoxin domain-containing protein [Chitinophagaceae bacterium]|nr:redoxin domain-containing protein [Chitinophagaceae bacterium]